MFDLNVVIIGGGIGGLSAGIFLKRLGYTVHVYERAAEILPIGAAISLWSNGVKVMNSLGLGKDMQRMGGKMDHMIYHSEKDEPWFNLDLNPMYSKVGERGYPVARAELQKLLMDTYVATGAKLTLGKTCVGVEKVDPSDENSKVVAVFNDGTKSSVADLLIGADGIRSTVREYVIGEKLPLFYRYTNWNGLVKMSPKLGKSNEWIMWVGEGKRASIMPVGKDRFYFFMGAPLPEDNFKTAPPRGSEAQRDELKKIFKNFPKRVHALIDSIDVKQSLNRLPICDIEALPTFCKGRVALLGDSAHPTLPVMGQGGALALEDSQILAHMLETTNISVVDALRRYVEHRRDRTHRIVLKGRERVKQIYPRCEEDIKSTQMWYDTLKNSKSFISKVEKGLLYNLSQGPFPPREIDESKTKSMAATDSKK
eukprot:CAMPEP_0170184448 /NCGR_PEP_ID=MMETSP0040_2-20121228/33653_1 /TAXON_ID=641309 /ORGANISM="Lotharella oceanica, Strain CCMP622" /LENGTH=424 /DNA_ID=CAMNT_0010430527 /DNA_START=1 /DNA_END=1275 /DNA_ORIENTATION=-